MSDESSREWIELTPLIRIDRRVNIGDYPERIKEEVEAIAASHDAPLLQVEVIPYEWELDQNFSSVLIRFTSTLDSFSRVYSLTTDSSECRTVLTYIPEKMRAPYTLSPLLESDCDDSPHSSPPDNS